MIVTTRINKLFKSVAPYVALVLATLFCIWPATIMIEEGFAIDLSPLFSGRGIRFVGGVPSYSGGINPTLIHYADLFAYDSFLRLITNSTIISLMSIAIALLAGLPAAYALARLALRGKSILAFLLLALRTVSPFAIVLPLFVAFVHNGLWDSRVGMSVAYLVIDLPVVVWMLRGFFADIPTETYQAAEISGASERQIFWRIALPLVLPGVAATAVFAFTLLWNEYLMASILTGPSAKTAMVGIWAGTGESVGFRTVGWDDLNAAGAISFVPALLLVLLIKKYLIRGFSLATAR